MRASTTRRSWDLASSDLQVIADSTRRNVVTSRDTAMDKKMDRKKAVACMSVSYAGAYAMQA
jgi:hypothetical protein